MITRLYSAIIVLLLLTLSDCKKEPEQVEYTEPGSLELSIAYRKPLRSEIPDYLYIPEDYGYVYLWSDTAQCLTCGRNYIEGGRPKLDGYHNEFGDLVGRPNYKWSSNDSGLVGFSEITPGYYLLAVESRTELMYSLKIVKIMSGETLRLCKYFSNAARFSDYDNEEPWDFVMQGDTIPDSCN